MPGSVSMMTLRGMVKQPKPVLQYSVLYWARLCTNGRHAERLPRQKRCLESAMVPARFLLLSRTVFCTVAPDEF